MSFSKIVGQNRAISALVAGLKSGQLHHAYLFGGPQSVGKELVALTLAQAANCEQGNGDACGVCGPCRRVSGRNHADVMLVLPEAEQVARGFAGRADFEATPSREIKIAQIRVLQERLALRALEARRKFAIIAPAEAMNVQAQNALLKTLEEPPSDTTLILVSAAPHALLPTIRSRCLKLSFAPLPLDFVAQRVASERNTDMSTARLCASLASGSLSAAMEFDPATLAQRRELIERLQDLSLGQARQALQFAADFGADRARAEIHFDLMSAWYRDLAALASGGPKECLVNNDLTQLAVDSAARISAGEALRRIDLCNSAKARLASNASPRLQMEETMLRFLFPQ